MSDNNVIDMNKNEDLSPVAQKLFVKTRDRRAATELAELFEAIFKGSNISDLGIVNSVIDYTAEGITEINSMDSFLENFVNSSLVQFIDNCAIYKIYELYHYIKDELEADKYLYINASGGVSCNILVAKDKSGEVRFMNVVDQMIVNFNTVGINKLLDATLLSLYETTVSYFVVNKITSELIDQEFEYFEDERRDKFLDVLLDFSDNKNEEEMKEEYEEFSS